MKQLITILFFLPLLGFAQSDSLGMEAGTRLRTPDENRAIAKMKIDSLRLRVIKGESMALLAGMYSEDPGSASNGGKYSKVVKGMMVPEFEEAAFKLQPGQISEVFETQYGFHFIQLISRFGDQLELRHILIIPR